MLFYSRCGRLYCIGLLVGLVVFPLVLLLFWCGRGRVLLFGSLFVRRCGLLWS